MATQPPVIYDAIVVGAGYSGLAAARHLVQAGKTVRVLEARDRVGGRAKTILNPDGSAKWDVGAAFLGNQQDLMYGLAKEFGVELWPTPTDGKTVLSLRRNRKAKTYSGLIPPMRPWEVLDAGWMLHKLEKLIKTANVEEPWKTPGAERLDKLTVQEWMVRNSWTEAARDTMRMSVDVMLATSPAAVSMLHAAFFFKSLVSFQSAASVEGGAQEHLIRGGGQAIANKMAEALGPEVVHLEEPVRGVNWDTEAKGGAEVRTDKATYRSRKVILAVPPLFVLKMDFSPRLPVEKETLLANMPMGQYMKVLATYETRFWRARGLRGECTSPDGFVCYTADVTAPDADAVPKLVAFVGGVKLREFITFDEEKRRRVFLGELVKMLGPEAGRPKEVFMHTMMDEEWSRGCPLAVPAPGMWTTFGEWLRKPIGPMHWAGTETSSKYYGYMEGAVFAGRRAAKEVIEALS